MKPTILLCAVVVAVVLLEVTAVPSREMPAPRAHLAINAYACGVYYAREGRDFNKDLGAGLRDVADCGLDGFEPILETSADAERIGTAAKQAGLAMLSAYVNTTLHRATEAAESISRVTKIAEGARPYGTRILVTNPNPIRWGAAEDKSDDELTVQARALNDLGKALAARRMTLAYHNHDIELRQAARELHHMMLGTDPRYVKLCLDAQWIYRGSGNSSVALFDIVELYGRRVVELHLRQSNNGTWAEVLGPGDIDHERLARRLQAMRIRPHLVLEQAVESGTPQTMRIGDAFRRSSAYARQVFGPLLGER